MAKVTSCPFLVTDEGVQTYLYRIENSKGHYVELTDLGACIVSIVVPDRHGLLRDVCLSYRTLKGFLTGEEYLGATVGRCAGRIAKGQFTLNGRKYQLAVNNGKNHLHGGINSFSRKVWKVTIKDNSVIFELTSPDADESYPGKLDVDVIFSFSEDDKLSITWNAFSLSDTICNLTNHVYFNLNGERSTGILDNDLKINATEYIEVDENMIPTKAVSVKDTPFDFRHPKLIGEEIYNDNEQLKIGNGYDHSFIVRDNPCVIAHSSQSGITLTCETSYPIVHLYTGNFVNVSAKDSKGGHPYKEHQGFCLETQLYNDAINHPEFPTTILRSGQRYHYKTTYSFIVD